MTNDPVTWDSIFGACPGYENMPSDYDAGYAAALRDAVEAVKALGEPSKPGVRMFRGDALAAIEGLSATPVVQVDEWKNGSE